MASFQGKRVSTYWQVVLQAAWDAGVRFRLNSGQRTMDEQWTLYRQNMSNGRPRPGRPLTAYPDPNAPHIRRGKQHHALDVDSYHMSGETALQNWLRSEGIAANNTVPGESWHLEVTSGGLKKLYKRYRASHKYPERARRWIREYDRLKRQNKNRQRRSVLRREMKKLRKAYWGKTKYAGVYTALLRRSR